MVGSLEKVKEKDQEQKNYEMAIRLSQQDDPKPKSKGKKKRGIFEIDPIMARFGPGSEEASERKKRKKTPKKTPASSTSTSGSLNQPSTSTVSEFLTIRNFKCRKLTKSLIYLNYKFKPSSQKKFHVSLCVVFASKCEKILATGFEFGMP